MIDQTLKEVYAVYPNPFFEAGSYNDPSAGKVKMAVSKSTNDGATWNLSILGSETGEVRAIAVNPGDNNIVYAGGFSRNDTTWYTHSRLYKSTDGGGSWSEIGTTTFNTQYDYIYGLCLDPFNPNKLLVGTANGVYTSIDGGLTWMSPAQQFSVQCLIPDPSRAGSYYAGSTTGVWTSNDGGANWQQMNTGLTSLSVLCLACDAVTGYLYAGTEVGGVFRLNIVTDVDGRSIVPPEGFSLYQNFPNPFNPSTTIRFDVPERSRIRLTVFNIVGQQIAELVNEEMSAGAFERTWNAQVTSGIYFYRIDGTSTDNPNRHFVDVKKMILVK